MPVEALFWLRGEHWDDAAEEVVVEWEGGRGLLLVTAAFGRVEFESFMYRLWQRCGGGGGGARAFAEGRHGVGGGVVVLVAPALL